MIKKALIVLFIFALVYAAYFASRSLDFYKSIYKNSNGSTNTPVVKTEYNFLLLGYGGPPHDGPYLTDSMMVAHVDLVKNTIALISLPRDLWIKLPTKSGTDFHSKINSLYQMGMYESTNFPDVNVGKVGTADLVKSGVKTITGLTIDNIITVDFSGFEKAVDALGGVDVKVLKTFDDYEYPIDGKEQELCGTDAQFAQIEKFLKPGYDQSEMDKLFADHPDLKDYFQNITDAPEKAFPCRYEHLHFDAGMVHMDGATALKYVRSRHSMQDGTDFGRAARQQQFVLALKERILNVGMLAKVFPLMDELKAHISTDISIDEIKRFITEAKDAAKYRIINIRMSDADYLVASYSDYGGYILIPRTGQDNWKQIQTMIHNGILEIKLTPTPTPKLPTKQVTPQTK